MLPSCALCKKRKKKCDFNLPSCKNCESTGTQCEHFDEGLGNYVPREYIKSLSDNIVHLKYEIEKYKKKIDKRSLQTEGSPRSDSNLYDTIKNGIFIEGSDSELHYFGPCSVVAVTYMTTMLLKLNTTTFERVVMMDFKSMPAIHIPFDLNMITSEHTKILISNYLTEVYPVYPLLSESFFHFDLMVKNYPPSKQVFIFLTLLVSSAHLMRKRSDFVPIKIMLQHKVLELMKSRASCEDCDYLVCLILYAVYQLLDPENGESIRRTISLACDLAQRIHLVDYSRNDEIPGSITKDISKNAILKILLTLDSEVSIVLGKLPLLTMINQKISNIEEEQGGNLLRASCEKYEFYILIYSNSSNCKVCKIFQFQRYKYSKDYNLWLLASPLLSHRCNDCNLCYDSFVLNIMNASMSTISKFDASLKGTGIIHYWIALSKVAVSIMNLVLIRRIHSSCYSGFVTNDSVCEHILLGKQLISQISAQWYCASPVREFIDQLPIK